MKIEEIIFELNRSKEALQADKYKVWSYTMIAIDKAIHALSNPSEFGWVAKEETDELRTELDTLLCEVEGIFDGWHSDGTAWTEYDESVRKRLMEFRLRYTYTPPPTYYAQVLAENARLKEAVKEYDKLKEEHEDLKEAIKDYSLHMLAEPPLQTNKPTLTSRKA